MNLKRLSFILDRDLSAANIFEKALQRYGDQPFLAFDQPLALDQPTTKLSVASLMGWCNRFSNLLLAHGLRRFERVAIYKANAPDYFIYGMGAIRAGAVAVPINGGMATAVLFDYLNYTGARHLVTDSERHDALLQAGIHAHCPQLRNIFISGPSHSGGLPLGALLAEQPVTFAPVPLCSDEDMLIVHTSGTTGTPKGVLHTDGSFVAGLKGMLKNGPVMKQQKFLSAMPYNHYISFQSIASALIAGNEGVLVTDTAPCNLLALIQASRPEVVFSFPHSYVAMYDHGLDRHDLSSVKLWLAGADSSHEAHIREFVKHGSLLRILGKTILPSVYIDTLGTSEVGFPAFFRCSSKYSTLFSRCIGRRFFSGPQVKVADASGRRLPPNTTGRLMVKGPTLFKGYWNAHDRLHGEVKDGWWWTGDLGYRDPQGRHFHLDREVDQIQTSAGPVSSLLLEEHMLKHPAVVEAVVIGKNQPAGGTAPMAILQLRSGADTDPAHLQRWLERAIPPSAGCAGIRLVAAAEIPRGLTGKVLKRELRNQWNTAV